MTVGDFANANPSDASDDYLPRFRRMAEEAVSGDWKRSYGANCDTGTGES